MEDSANISPIYQHGDIGAKPNYSIIGKMNTAVFWPHTDLFHFWLIADYIEEEKDYVILESTSKGISVGRLSWYKDSGLRVFRIKDPDARKLGEYACRALTKHGQARYDYILFIKLFAGCLKVWLKHIGNRFTGKIKKMDWTIDPSELPYGRDSRFICTEAANEGWRLAGRPIIPKFVVPLPAGYIKALYIGKLLEVLPSGETLEMNYNWTNPRRWSGTAIIKAAELNGGMMNGGRNTRRPGSA